MSLTRKDVHILCHAGGDRHERINVPDKKKTVSKTLLYIVPNIYPYFMESFFKDIIY